MLTDDELARIAARAEAASPGPWGMYENLHGWHYTVPPDGADALGRNPRARANAEFVAHSREDIPRLVAALRAAREALDDVRSIVGETLHDTPTTAELKIAARVESALGES